MVLVLDTYGREVVLRIKDRSCGFVCIDLSSTAAFDRHQWKCIACLHPVFRIYVKLNPVIDTAPKTPDSTISFTPDRTRPGV